MHDSRYASLRALLVAERERAGLTQVDVAGRLGKPQSYVSKYERGERRIDLVEFLDIGRALGADPAEIVQKLLDRIA